MTIKGEFKQKYCMEERQCFVQDQLFKFPEKIPVVVEFEKHDTFTHKLKKQRFLFPFEMTFGQVLYVFRQKLELRKDESIFVFVDEQLFPTSQLIGNLYESNKDEDGFLYMVLSKEKTFGHKSH